MYLYFMFLFPKTILQLEDNSRSLRLQFTYNNTYLVLILHRIQCWSVWCLFFWCIQLSSLWEQVLQSCNNFWLGWWWLSHWQRGDRWNLLIYVCCKGCLFNFFFSLFKWIYELQSYMKCIFCCVRYFEISLNSVYHLP